MRKKLFFLVLTGLMVSCFFVPTRANAALTRAMVRPDRLKASTAPGPILITATTAENVTENGVQITVGSAWSISSTASNFTVSTANLPSGVTAWPGIGTATSVSGNIITFPANNIAQGTEYGFYITGGITTNPSTGTGLSYVWKVATLVGGIESSSIQAGVPIISNDQITLTASVIPDQTYYSAVLSSATSGTTVEQSTQLNFTLTYGMTYTADSPLTLQAEWDLGDILSSPGSTTNAVDYVIGSATNAYGSTVPVIDTVNRKITWTISSIPAGTSNQTVQFSLITNSNYTGSSTIQLDVHGRVTSPATTSDSTITHYYKYRSTVTPTPATSTTITDAPKKSCNTQCATDTECASNYCYMAEQKCRLRDTPYDDHCLAATSTPTPTPSPSVRVISVDVRSITDTTASIEARIPAADQLQIRHGTSPFLLDQQLISSSLSKTHVFDLSSLSTNTIYYFQFYSVSTGQPVSDVFTFKTALTKTDDVQPTNILVTAQSIPLYQTFVGQPIQSIIVPNGSSAELSAFFEGEVMIERGEIFVTDENGSQILLGELTNGSPGILSAKFLVPEKIGAYKLFFRLFTPDGALYEYSVVKMISAEKIKVVERQTQKSIEQAELTIWKYDEGRKLFVRLPAPSFLPTNPLITDSFGHVPLALASGVYKIEVKAFGFVTQEINFRLVGFEKDRFPYIEMTEIGWNPILLLQHYWKTFQFWLDKLFSESRLFGQSRTLLETLGLMSLLTLTVLTTLALQARTLQTIFGLISSFRHGLKFNPNYPHLSQKGVLIDQETKKPISGAKIKVFSKKEKQLLTVITANRLGIYHLPLIQQPILLQFEAIGYQFSEMIDPEIQKGHSFSLTKHVDAVHTLEHSLKVAVVNGFGLLFETLLVVSFIAQIIFARELGLTEVAPFMMVSFTNMLLWAKYLQSSSFFK